MRLAANKATVWTAGSLVGLSLCAAVWLLHSHGSAATVGAIDAVGRRVSARMPDLFSGQKLSLALLILTVLATEILVVGWRNSSLFRVCFTRRRSAAVDGIFFLAVFLGLSQMLSIVLTLGLSVAAARAVNWGLSQYGWSRIALPSDGPLQIAAGFAIYWLSISFFGYWAHRLMHTRYFWSLHRFHHAATELNVITMFRQHPVEPVVLGFLTLASPLIFFDVSDKILFVYFLWGTGFDLLAHSELPWGYGWFGRWIVHSPRVHQVHHSIEDEHRDLHFSTCPLWDHMFGTWYHGDKIPAAYGVPDNGYEVQPLRQFVFDALNFYATVVRELRAYLPSRRREPDAGPLIRHESNIAGQ